jgi:hypothetical protein
MDNLETPAQLIAVAPKINIRRRALLILVVCVVIFTVLGFIRYNSAAWTAKSFVDSVYGRNVPAAANLVCADAPALQSAVQLSGALFPPSHDAASFSYAIASESLTTATVAVSGAASELGSPTTSGTIALEALGISWCVTSAA